jgi:hypothetical protein
MIGAGEHEGRELEFTDPKIYRVNLTASMAWRKASGLSIQVFILWVNARPVIEQYSAQQNGLL